MLTITDFINILHRYYKSPMVSMMLSCTFTICHAVQKLKYQTDLVAAVSLEALICHGCTPWGDIFESKGGFVRKVLER